MQIHLWSQPVRQPAMLHCPPKTIPSELQHDAPWQCDMMCQHTNHCLNTHGQFFSIWHAICVVLLSFSFMQQNCFWSGQWNCTIDLPLLFFFSLTADVKFWFLRHCVEWSIFKCEQHEQWKLQLDAPLKVVEESSCLWHELVTIACNKLQRMGKWCSCTVQISTVVQLKTPDFDTLMIPKLVLRCKLNLTFMLLLVAFCSSGGLVFSCQLRNSDCKLSSSSGKWTPVHKNCTGGWKHKKKKFSIVLLQFGLTSNKCCDLLPLECWHASTFVNSLLWSSSSSIFSCALSCTIYLHLSQNDPRRFQQKLHTSLLECLSIAMSLSSHFFGCPLSKLFCHFCVFVTDLQIIDMSHHW